MSILRHTHNWLYVHELVNWTGHELATGDRLKAVRIYRVFQREARATVRGMRYWEDKLNSCIEDEEFYATMRSLT